MNKYSFDEKTPSKDAYERAKKKLDEISEVKKLDENNPLERAEKFRKVKQNPPNPDYMKVDFFEVTADDGAPTVETRGGGKTFVHDPFFSIDLNTLIESDVAAVPSNVVPMLIDQNVQLALDERNLFRREDKQSDQFRYWWILIIILIIPAVLVFIFTFL